MTQLATQPSTGAAAAIPAPGSRGRTLVVGAGAVGSFLGVLLASAGHDVTLVRIFEPNSQRPVELIRPDGSHATIPVHRVTRTADAPAPDLILVAVKMPMLREALEPTLAWPAVPTLTVENGIGAESIAAAVRPRAPQIAGSLTAPIAPASEDVVRWLGRGGIGLAPVTGDAAAPDLILVAVKMPMLREALEPTLAWPAVPTLTVENGIGAESIAADVRPRAPQIAGSLTAPIAPASEDEVRWLGRGGIGLAPATADAAALVPGLVADFRTAGFRARQLPAAAPMKWSKLLANLIANASGAILDMDGGEIYGDPGLFAMEREQLLEALRVMKALGLAPVSIPGAPVPWLVRGVRLPPALGRPILRRALGDARAGKMPSLRIHVRAAPPDAPSPEPTEVAWMNGAVAEHGARLGIATPINATLARLTEEVAQNPERRVFFRGRPDRLLAEVSVATRR